MGGIWGALATGIFCSAAVSPSSKNGLIYGNPKQVLIQLVAVISVAAFAFVMTWILGKIVNATIGLRVSPAEESVGLDISQHGERAYGGNLR
jgi:Amt family ammonium transporter